MSKFRIQEEWYSRTDVYHDRNSIYLFGENLDRTSGYNKIVGCRNPLLQDLYEGKNYPNKTQAVIRGLNNAYPITTKKGHGNRDYFHNGNKDFSRFYYHINKDFKRLVLSPNRTIVVPAGGFATGRAGLPERFALHLIDMFKDYGLMCELVNHPDKDGYYGVIPLYDIRQRETDRNTGTSSRG